MRLDEKWVVSFLKSQRRDAPSGVLSQYGIRYLKALCEITFFSLHRSSSTSSDCEEYLVQCVDEFVSSPVFLQMMRFNDKYSTLFVYLLEIAQRYGLLTQKVETEALLIAESYKVTGPERVPFRYIDIDYGLNKVGITTHENALNDAVNLSCIRDEYTINAIGLDDIYALTHIVFYLTDFGARTSSHIERYQLNIIAKIFELANYSVAVNNLDTLAELVLSLRYLGVNITSYQWFVQYIDERQAADGSWPGPFDTSADLKRVGVPQDHFGYFNNYHTTILCAQAVNSAIFKGRERKTLHVASISPGRSYQPRSVEDFFAELEDGVIASEMIFLLSSTSVTIAELAHTIREDISKKPPVPVFDNPGYSFLRFVFLSEDQSGAETGDISDISTPEEFYIFIISVFSSNEETRNRWSLVALSYFFHEKKYSFFIRTLAYRMIWNVGTDDTAWKEKVALLFSSEKEFLWYSPDQSDWQISAGEIGRHLFLK